MCVSACLRPYLSQTDRQAGRQTDRQTTTLSFCRSACLSVCMSVCLYVCLSVCLSSTGDIWRSHSRHSPRPPRSRSTSFHVSSTHFWQYHLPPPALPGLFFAIVAMSWMDPQCQHIRLPWTYNAYFLLCLCVCCYVFILCFVLCWFVVLLRFGVLFCLLLRLGFACFVLSLCCCRDVLFCAFRAYALLTKAQSSTYFIEGGAKEHYLRKMH